MKRFLKIAGMLFLGVIILIVISMAILANRPSGYSNCVVAENADAFIGTHLKYRGNAQRDTVRIEECLDLDRKIDAADGRGKGRVRWVECSMGPDCDEAGMN